MSHLLAISIGPVQEFIAAARRTRDLWFGSHLLSEISRTVAKSVEEQGGGLIFPASTDAPNVANVILAELSEADPRAVAIIAREAALECWRGFAERARRDASGVVDQRVWESQINDVIELQAAWVARTADYPSDRARAMWLLSGRKNCRDFSPAAGVAGAPKSSLDGRRESVINGMGRANRPGSIRLAPGEQLDVVGVTKRLGRQLDDDHPSYPSITRIAADSWLRSIAAEKPKAFQRLSDACDALARKGVLNRVNEQAFSDFPYEGAIVYRNRHVEFVAEQGIDAGDLNPVVEALEGLKGGAKDDFAYLAVLVADGDRMGAALSRMDSPGRHREFSRALAGFAGEAKRIVGEHRGVLVYAGGDDVLAFLPVDKCLTCARQLRDAFGGLPGETGAKPTLSVGIAIGHFMEGLEDLLNWGRAAEKAAKGKESERDGLAVHLHKRSGAPIQVRAGWTESPPPDQRIADCVRLSQSEALPGRLPYELQKLADLYDSWSSGDAPSALRADVLRVIRKKQPRSGCDESARLIGEAVKRLNDADDLRGFARELLVARLIARAAREVGGEATS